MVVMIVESHQNARVHTIALKNKDFFGVKIIDVHGLDLKYKRGLIRSEICGIFGINDLRKEQK